MIIRSVHYAGTIVTPRTAPPSTLPQVAFLGRSNVGKSSLINSLVDRTRRRQARVSARPGKTRALNFFEVNERFCLVDLPGYGYAEVPQALRNQWGRLVEWYLSSGFPAGAVQLIDSRHDPTKLDHRMFALLADTGLPTVVLLTKVDKLRPKERRQVDSRVGELLGIGPDQIIPYSSKTGQGREDMLNALEALMEEVR